MEYQQRSYADQLNIETPEQVDLRFPVAGIGSRFVALLIDHGIQIGTYVLIILVFVIFANSAGGASAAHTEAKLDTAGKWVIAIIIFVHFCLIWGYFTLFEAFWHGQTPGKRIMKLRVIKDSGRQITLFESLARNLLRFVDLMPNFYLAGVVTMLCNRKNKRLGDLAAGTLVIHEMHIDQHAADVFVSGENFFARGVEESQGGLPADAIARLDANDLHVMETFFARALDLDMQTRAAMAARIAQLMAAKMGVALPEGNPERVLETMAKAMRGTGRRF